MRTALLTSVGGAAPDLAVVLVGLLLGAVAGSIIGIDAALTRFGGWVERRFTGRAAAEGERSIARALITSSLVFCVGPLTILGSFQDGAQGDILLLGIKSGLDGVAALAFTVSLGPGVLLSAVTVLVVQGSLTAAAWATRGSLDPLLVTQALSAGGFLLVGIGLVLLDIRRIAVADLLPALLAAPLVAALVRAWHLPI